MHWTDTLDIAIALDEAHPDIDPTRVNFVDLRNWTLALEDFQDDPAHSGEKILEAFRWPGSRNVPESAVTPGNCPGLPLAVH